MDRTCTISKSQSLDSLHAQSTKDTTMFTSTKIQPTKIKISNNNNRRKAILPTPNKPKNERGLLIMNTKNNSCNDDQIAKLKTNRNQEYDNDVLYEFDITNESFVLEPKIPFNIDPNDNIENSVVSKSSYRPNRFDQLHKFDQSSNQHEKCNRLNTKNFLEKDSLEYDRPKYHSHSEDEDNNESFDEFILRNFIPFTSRQNVLQCLTKLK